MKKSQKRKLQKSIDALSKRLRKAKKKQAKAQLVFDKKVKACKKKLKPLLAELEAAKSQSKGLKRDLREASNKLKSRANKASRSTKRESSAEAKPATVEQNNLKVVLGIGPKIEKLLYSQGITSWTQLANGDVDDLKRMLEHAGPSYASQNPTTWPRQAELAAQGQMQELKEWQERFRTKSAVQ